MSLAQRAQRLVSLFSRGRFREAEILARQLVEEHPDYAFAWKVLGSAVAVQGGDGAPMLERAVHLMPDDHEAQNNLGNAYMELRRFGDAAASYRRALALKPDYAHAHGNLANALRALRQRHEAVHAYRRALELRPDFAEAHNNLGRVLLDLGELEPATACFRRALEADADFVEARSSLLFALNSAEREPTTALLAEARRYGEHIARRARPFARWTNVPDPARALNVGLVSGDLRSHAVGFFLESTVAALSPDRLRLHAYETHAASDGLTERLRARMVGWYCVEGLSDERLAGKIRADGIDILVDLSGHTTYSRLAVFAWKPAPVQVTWLGYFATTGVPGMDYVLVDRLCVPDGEDDHFTETVWRLPDTRFCFSAPKHPLPLAALPALATGHVTFGCFGTQLKANDGVIATWADVLQAVPRAKLYLKAPQFSDELARKRVVERFARRDIGSERLIVEAPSPRPEYLAAYNRVDIALDTFPYPGGTTTLEGLWMGVPLITLRGERLLSRQGESMLVNAGLEAWIAADRRHYVELASAMSSDLGALAQLRASLRARLEASPLMNAQRFAGHLEAALRGMWRRWCDRQA
jgi:protein O-GlcNAc transferase